MATHCHGSGECQNIGVVSSFEGKKGGVQLETKNQIGVVTCKMCLFSLYFVKYISIS